MNVSLDELDEYFRKRTRFRRFLDRLPAWPSNAKWWILHRFHPRHRYHIIDTGRGPGWCDRDEILERVMVKIVIDFVEKEKPFEHFDTEASGNAEAWVALRDVYNRCKSIDWDEFYGRRPKTETDRWLTELLIDIVRVRDIMWT